MAVHQAAAAFRLFTGIEADAAQMRRDFDQLVSARRSLAGTDASVPSVA